MHIYFFVIVKITFIVAKMKNQSFRFSLEISLRFIPSNLSLSSALRLRSFLSRSRSRLSLLILLTNFLMSFWKGEAWSAILCFSSKICVM